MRKITFLSLSLLFLPHLFSQDQKWNERIDQLSDLYRQETDYRLGGGDLIEIAVYGVDSFQHTLRINSSGSINLPLVGEVEARGLTAAQLEQKLRTLLDGDLIRNPHVSVFVKEYRSQPLLILGAVNRPGQYQIIQQTHLIDVIAMAGGLKANAADHVVLQRRASRSSQETDNSPPDLPQVVKIDLKALLTDGDLSLNVPVQGGDVINVPERQVELFYVIGEVHRAGPFELPSDKNLLLTQAVALAGGPTRTAKAKNARLVRYDQQGGGRQDIALNVSAILKGEEPDIPIRPNDVIFIPGSNIKTIGYGMLGIIPTIAANAVLYGAFR